MPITEANLQERIGKIESGKLFPQIYITIAVCMGHSIFGAIFGWSSPGQKHIREMLVSDFETQYAWTVTLGPLATALGMFPCWFFAKRIGPRKTMLIQTPFNVLCWVLVGFTHGVNFYHTLRFFIAFFSTTYYYCGEEFMIEAVHRKYQKVMYSFYRTSFFIGVLLMNSVGSIVPKMDLHLYGASAVIVTFLVTIVLPESPVFLMRHNPEKAKKSLRWYRGNTEIRGELESIANYVTFQKYETTGFVPMLKTKVVLKALKVCGILFVLKGLSGYYAFILHSPRWFTSKYCCITPHIDCVVFSCIVIIVRFISVLVHLYGRFGIKKPLLVSTFATSVLLIIFGYFKFILERVTEGADNCVTLPIMIMYTLAYECGLSLCPEITLYNYLPFQIYSLVKKIMQMLLWIMLFIVIRVYLLTITQFHSYITLWVLALNMFIGYILVMICVVEAKGKSLMKIQIELGGNPIGTRGSRRQRIASPMDQLNTDSEIRELIRKYSQTDSSAQTSTSTQTNV